MVIDDSAFLATFYSSLEIIFSHEVPNKPHGRRRGISKFHLFKLKRQDLPKITVAISDVNTSISATESPDSSSSATLPLL